MGRSKYHILLAGIYVRGVTNPEVRSCQWKGLNPNRPKNQTDVQVIILLVLIIQKIRATTILFARSCPYSGLFHGIDFPLALLARLA